MTPVLFINCSETPYIDLITKLLKPYETRTRNVLKTFLKYHLGERILLAETGRGDPMVRCSAVIDYVVTVTTKEEWEKYRSETCVPVDGSYDWKPETKIKYLYHLSDVREVVPFRLPKDAKRHGRIWAELPDLCHVSYWNSGGGVLCYSAMYKGMYWIFGNEDWMDAYTIDVGNEPWENGGPDGLYCGDPEPYMIEDATDFPTWKEVLDSIPDDDVLRYWESREALESFTRRWQDSTLDKRVNEE